ncbi:hypothetical protein BT63DRAFT_421969 [Microthyrium microscopicum]|uniref:FAD-binding FR-type domain-containing protein n=1 Tax=Microthyrium microscopicum TaxID=703497 RepID=A0A6A6UQY3_9PEZI|nr:hypothetical protein BT63DRAFT_421969 [Microthyrium microscopicum]
MPPRIDKYLVDISQFCQHLLDHQLSAKIGLHKHFKRLHSPDIGTRPIYIERRDKSIIARKGGKRVTWALDRLFPRRCHLKEGANTDSTRACHFHGAQHGSSYPQSLIAIQNSIILSNSPSPSLTTLHSPTPPSAHTGIYNFITRANSVNCVYSSQGHRFFSQNALSNLVASYKAKDLHHHLIRSPAEDIKAHLIFSQRRPRLLRALYHLPLHQTRPIHTRPRLLSQHSKSMISQHDIIPGAASAQNETDCSDMIPSEPSSTAPEHAIMRQYLSIDPSAKHQPSPRSSRDSLVPSYQSSTLESPTTPHTEPQSDEELDNVSSLAIATVEHENGKPRRASTSLVTQNRDDLTKILGDPEAGTTLLQKLCCGGGCCLAKPNIDLALSTSFNDPIIPCPENKAFKSLKLNLGELSLDTELTSIAPLPEQTVSLEALASQTSWVKPKPSSTFLAQPPSFVQPHPPYQVYSAPIFNARELTKSDAEKRTFHFDIDVTDYPVESGVDFKVGGAVGVCPPNDDGVVDDIFDRLGIPKFLRDKPFTVRTTGGRWPTIWGEEQARELTATRRELLTWCCDVQGTPPTKQLLRVLAEHASDPSEKKILTYLVSSEGQGAFCDLRTGPYITLPQLLHAFPSSQPPLDILLTCLKQLMPRFYSLSNDPHVSSSREGLSGRRLIEMAVTIHEMDDWRNGTRTGIGSGYMERVAKAFIAQQAANPDATPNLHIPLFRGLMANPLSREFITDGPMLLIGAGVGIAPFRGFILNRFKNANCANKVWLLQGIRDSSKDELYSGELGNEESQIKRVVQSRKADPNMGEAKYVQEEVVHQADIVWFVANAVDGRVFVCGSSEGMGEGVHEALVQVAMQKGGLDVEQAEAYWASKREGGQYIAEVW